MKGRKRIEKLRKKINTIDLELLKLLNARAGVAIEVGKVKRGENYEFYSPIREREIYRRMSALNKGPFPDSAVRDIFREIMSASLSLEKPLKVSFLGPHATFTHHAAIEHFGSSARFLPEKEISDVFDDVERGKALFGVVPIENTIEGAVSHTLDMLIQSNLTICAEVMTEVSLCLLSRTGKTSGIARVASHPHAIKECARWLKENLPDKETLNVASTATAAEMARKDPKIAAIASEAAAKVYNLKIVERKIEDNPNNFTRFLVIGKRDAERTGSDKTSVVFSVKDEPGALYRMLKPFAERKINLTKIESRPLKTRVWEYVFFVDLDGHRTDKKIKEAITGLGKRCQFLKVLGSYPKSQ